MHSWFLKVWSVYNPRDFTLQHEYTAGARGNTSMQISKTKAEVLNNCESGKKKSTIMI
jgi:hypothetical protein